MNRRTRKATVDQSAPRRVVGAPTTLLRGVYGAVAGLAYGRVTNTRLWPSAGCGPEISYVAGSAILRGLRRAGRRVAFQAHVAFEP